MLYHRTANLNSVLFLVPTVCQALTDVIQVLLEIHGTHRMPGTVRDVIQVLFVIHDTHCVSGIDRDAI